MFLMSFFTILRDDFEKLWKHEEPTIEAALKAAVKSVEPVWKTALGAIVLSTVTNLQGLAQSAGGTTAATTAAARVAAAAEAAGLKASKSTINTFIELAVQKLNAANAALGTTAPAPKA